MKTVTIKSRFTDAVLFSCEVEEEDAYPIRTAIAKAIADYANLGDANLSGANLGDADLRYANLRCANLSDANLRGANLRGANLSGANLSGANLSDANLSCANLGDADLRYANLRGANLSCANLGDANLRDANLSYADLRYANLRGANLSCANLSYANLGDANLRDANLSYADLGGIRDDFHAKLDLVQAEVPALLDAVRAGKIDGSVYQGECACFVGTIANIRKENYERMVDLRPEASSPTEKFFLGVRTGDTPANNPVSACIDDMIVSWQAMRGEGELIAEVQS